MFRRVIFKRSRNIKHHTKRTYIRPEQHGLSSLRRIALSATVGISSRPPTSSTGSDVKLREAAAFKSMPNMQGDTRLPRLDLRVKFSRPRELAYVDA